MNDNNHNNESSSQQIERILASAQPMHSLQQLSVQDVLFALHEKGLAESIDFLALLSTEQIRGIIDVDCWIKGRIHPLKVGNFFSALMVADRRVAVKQFLAQDLELISLLFKLHTKVYDLSAEEEPEEASSLHSITPDRKYFISFKGTGETAHIVHFLQQVIEELYVRDMAFVLRLIESLRWELPALLEDEAFRWREGRVLDLGFPTDEEAHEAMLKLNPKNIRKKVAGAGHIEHSSVMLRSFAKNESGLLVQALAHLSVPMREEVLDQIGFLTNCVALSQDCEWGNFEGLKQSTHFVIEMVDHALEYLGKEESTTAEILLQRYMVKDLFKVGRFVVEQR